MRQILFNSVAAGAIVSSLSIGAAEAADAASQMAENIDLPLDHARHYYDPGQSTVIREQCRADETNSRYVVCRLDIIGHGPKLVLSQDVVYMADETGNLAQMEVRLVSSRKKEVDDNERYKAIKDAAVSYDESRSPVMGNAMADNFGLTGAYDGFANVSRQGTSIILSSYVGANAQRGFALQNQWDLAQGLVSGSVTPLVSVAAGTLPVAPGIIQSSTRGEWSRYDSDNFNYYLDCVRQGGRIDYTTSTEFCAPMPVR